MVLHRAQESYDKWGKMWRQTNGGFLAHEGPYDNFLGEISRLAALECWCKNRFVAKDIYPWVRALNEIIELDKVRYTYRISSEEITKLLAFAKDCVIGNNNPTFNVQRRRTRKNSRTKIK